jgi:hypothetical protein
MREPLPPSSADQVRPPIKPCLTQDQLDEYWDQRGLKYQVDALHRACLSYGMNVAIDRPRFRAMLYSMLQNFLVLGQSKLDPKKEALPRWPKVG